MQAVESAESKLDMLWFADVPIEKKLIEIKSGALLFVYVFQLKDETSGKWVEAHVDTSSGG